eukprot:1997193-Rhodomonas_salina.1
MQHLQFEHLLAQPPQVHSSATSLRARSELTGTDGYRPTQCTRALDTDGYRPTRWPVLTPLPVPIWALLFRETCCVLIPGLDLTIRSRPYYLIVWLRATRQTTSRPYLSPTWTTQEGRISSGFARRCPVLTWDTLYAFARWCPVLTWDTPYAFARRCPVLTSPHAPRQCSVLTKGLWLPRSGYETLFVVCLERLKRRKP